MSRREAELNVGKAFESLRNMDIDDADDLHEYLRTFMKMLSKIQAEADGAAAELKLKLLGMDHKRLELSRIQLQIYARQVAGTLGKIGTDMRDGQKHAVKTRTLFENKFSDEAIRERRQERLRKEKERKQKEEERKRKSRGIR